MNPSVETVLGMKVHNYSTNIPSLIPTPYWFINNFLVPNFVIANYNCY